MINTDHIQPHVIDYATAEFVSPTSVTVVSPLVNSTDHPPEVAAMIIDDSRLPTVPTIQPASQERFIVVAIPQGAEAGAILDIQAPDGSMVSVRTFDERIKFHIFLKQTFVGCRSSRRISWSRDSRGVLIKLDYDERI
jgi:hypothetical protein